MTEALIFIAVIVAGYFAGYFFNEYIKRHEEEEK
jgi:hypothetical protein